MLIFELSVPENPCIHEQLTVFRNIRGNLKNRGLNCNFFAKLHAILTFFEIAVIFHRINIFFEIVFLNWSYRPFEKPLCNTATNYFKNIFIFNWEKFNLKNLLEFSSLVGSLCSKVVQNNQIYNIAFKIN